MARAQGARAQMALAFETVYGTAPVGGERSLEPRSAVHDEELRPTQAPADEIVENGTPGLGRLPAHVLDRE